MAPSGCRGPAASASERRDLLFGVAFDFGTNHRDGFLGPRLQKLPDPDALVTPRRILEITIVVLDVFELIVEHGDERVVVIGLRHHYTLPGAADRRGGLRGQLRRGWWGSLPL